MKRTALFSRLEQSMTIIGKQMYNTQASGTDCSPAQNYVLGIIDDQNVLSVKQIAEKLHVTSGAVTQHIDALVRSDLLSRTVNPSNRREVLVRLTARGEIAVHEHSKAKLKMFTDLFGRLSDNELQTLVELVEKVSQQYIATYEGGRA